MRSFGSAAERDRQEEAFYGGEAWRSGPREAILSLIDAYHTLVLELPADAVRAVADGLAAEA